MADSSRSKRKYQVLTMKNRADVQELHQMGMSLRIIADYTGISKSHIGRLVEKKGSGKSA